MRSTAVLVALLTLGGQAPSVPPAQGGSPGGPFVLGVLRRDGLALPFAAYDGRRWSVSWPDRIFNLALPHSFGQIPPEWWGKAGPQPKLTAWVEGARRGPVTVGRPVPAPVSCNTQLMLTTDYRGADPVPPRYTFPYPKDGLVVAPDRPMERVDIVPPTAKEWNELGLSMLPAFDEAEQRAIKDYTDWKHPVPRMERLKVPLRIEAIYRASMDTPGWTAYYVEAVKLYAPGPGDDGCGLVTSAWGWVLDGPPGKRKFDLGAKVTYCDRKNVPYMFPLALMRLDGRAYWIYQSSGTQLEGYIVARPTPDRAEIAARFLAAQCDFFSLIRRGRGGQ